MARAGPQGLNVASWRRRVGALCIDTVIFVPPFLAVVGGASWLYVRYRGTDPERLGSFTLSTRWNVIVWVASAAAAVPSRNWRSPGYRALGLRRLDARTGGPLTVRNVLVRHSVAMVSGRLRRRLTKPWQTRTRRRHEALRPEMQQIRRAHADDREAQERALKEFYKRNRVNAAGSCGPSLVGVALIQAPALWSPLNQTLPERLAGIVVVQD